VWNVWTVTKWEAAKRENGKYGKRKGHNKLKRWEGLSSAEWRLKRKMEQRYDQNLSKKKKALIGELKGSLLIRKLGSVEPEGKKKKTLGGGKKKGCRMGNKDTKKCPELTSQFQLGGKKTNALLPMSPNVLIGEAEKLTF